MVGNARPGRARNALIGIQVFASALLLICAAIFLRSAIASSRFDPGFRTADTMIDRRCPTSRSEPAMVQAIAVRTGDRRLRGACGPAFWRGRDPGRRRDRRRRTPVGYKSVSSEYFAVFDIPIVRGRSFTAAEGDGEHPVAIVTEATARQLWPGRSGVGETFRLEPEPASGRRSLPANRRRRRAPVMVVGVSRDVAGFRFLDTKEAGLFLPTHVHAPNTAVVARVRGESAAGAPYAPRSAHQASIRTWA